jgi:hypothetical protein
MSFPLELSTLGTTKSFLVDKPQEKKAKPISTWKKVAVIAASILSMFSPAAASGLPKDSKFSLATPFLELAEKQKSHEHLSDYFLELYVENSFERPFCPSFQLSDYYLALSEKKCPKLLLAPYFYEIAEKQKNYEHLSDYFR